MNQSETAQEAVVQGKRVAAKQRRTAIESDAVRKAAEARRVMRVPIVLTGVLPGKHRVFKVEEFGSLDYDPRYQREKITEEVSDLIYVLRNGGEVPQAIVVGKRLYSEGGSISKKFWIIDGLQRFLAHMEAGRPVTAMVHEIETLEAERNFFLVMNTHKRVSANHMVQSSSTRSAALIRKIAEAQGHPLFDRVNFGNGGSARIPASIIARGLLALYSGRPARGTVLEHLSRVDSYWRGEDQRIELKGMALLGLIGKIFPSGYAPTLAVEALGCVAAIRWEKLISGPSEPQITRLRKTNWRTVAPSYAGRFFGVMTSHVERIWR